MLTTTFFLLIFCFQKSSYRNPQFRLHFQSCNTKKSKKCDKVKVTYHFQVHTWNIVFLLTWSIHTYVLKSTDINVISSTLLTSDKTYKCIVNTKCHDTVSHSTDLNENMYRTSHRYWDNYSIHIIQAIYMTVQRGNATSIMGTLGPLRKLEDFFDVTSPRKEKSWIYFIALNHNFL